MPKKNLMRNLTIRKRFKEGYTPEQALRAHVVYFIDEDDINWESKALTEIKTLYAEFESDPRIKRIAPISERVKISTQVEEDEDDDKSLPLKSQKNITAQLLARLSGRAVKPNLTKAPTIWGKTLTTHEQRKRIGKHTPKMLAASILNISISELEKTALQQVGIKDFANKVLGLVCSKGGVSADQVLVDDGTLSAKDLVSNYFRLDL